MDVLRDPPRKKKKTRRRDEDEGSRPWTLRGARDGRRRAGPTRSRAAAGVREDTARSPWCGSARARAPRRSRDADLRRSPRFFAARVNFFVEPLPGHHQPYPQLDAPRRVRRAGRRSTATSHRIERSAMNASALARSRTPPQLSTSAPRRDDPGRRSTNNHRRSLAMRTRAVHREDASASDAPRGSDAATSRRAALASIALAASIGAPLHIASTLPRAHSSTTPTRGKSLNKRVDRSSDSRITPRAAPTAGTSRAAPAWCGLTYPPGTPASATSSPTSTSSHPTTYHPTRTNKVSLF
jgi:hypothetical protein